MANFKNFNFKQKPRLVVNGTEYDFEPTISGEFHIFNKSSMTFNKVWHKDGRDRMRNSIKFPSFSIVELYFGNDLAFFGVKKKQDGIDLNPFKPKHVDITVIDFKEWLTHKPMDFVIYRKKPEWVVNEVVKKLAEKRIKVGQLQFSINNDIRAYDTKDKTAYDVLRMVEKKTQSILQILPNAQGEMEINFFTRDSAKVNKAGVQLDLQDQLLALAFYQQYQVTKFEAKEDVVKYANQIRVESEKALYETPTNIEIDLTVATGSHSLSLSVGNFDKTSAELINADGTKARNLIVITKDESSKGKSYDIAYSINDRSIDIHPSLIGKSQRIKFSYYGIGRISYQFDDIAEQKRVASISDTNGILHRYEKHNDETTPSDMIALGKGYLEKNNTPRLVLEVASKLPIWDLGEHTTLRNYVTPEIDGEYIVFKMKIDQIVNNDGEVTTTYQYELLNTLDFEDRINKDDPQRYRDNPIYDAKDITYTTRQDIQEEVFLIFENFGCAELNADGSPIRHKNGLGGIMPIRLSNNLILPFNQTEDYDIYINGQKLTIYRLQPYSGHFVDKNLVSTFVNNIKTYRPDNDEHLLPGLSQYEFTIKKENDYLRFDFTEPVFDLGGHELTSITSQVFKLINKTTGGELKGQLVSIGTHAYKLPLPKGGA